MKEKDKKMSTLRQGEFYSINSREVKGHKGLLTKKNHNGIIEIVIITHSKYTNHRKNIELIENPQPSDKRTSYVVRKKRTTQPNKTGKRHKDMKVTNAVDKSIIRKIKNNKKKKRWSKLNSPLSQLSLLL